MAANPVVGIERVWHALMVLLGGTLQRKALAGRIIVRTQRANMARNR